MNKEYFLKNYGKTNWILTSISLAATWLWTPAMYVSSSISAQYGIYGLLYFLIPNVLTLIIFGYFAHKVKCDLDGFTFFEFIKKKAYKGQYYLHIAMSLYMLICCTTILLIGLKILFHTIFPNISTYLILNSIMIIMLIYTIFGGIKISIYSDVIKYIVMFICFVPIIFLKIDYTKIIQPYNINQLTLFRTFGFATSVNLLLACFLDQTFWQRIFSSKKEYTIKIGYLSALFFCIFPLFFGIIGMTQFQNDNFNIVQYLISYPYNILIIIITCCLLISTIDSDLAALSSIVWNEFNLIYENKKYIYSIIGMCLLSIISLYISSIDFSMITFTMIYGTMRTCTGIPSILMILNKFNPKRLFYATLLSVVICNIGFIYYSIHNPQITWIFTLLTIIIPLFGISFKNEN